MRSGRGKVSGEYRSGGVSEMRGEGKRKREKERKKKIRRKNIRR
jgi:hypothetical protein